jgi:serine/threonine protein kinase
MADKTPTQNIDELKEHLLNEATLDVGTYDADLNTKTVVMESSVTDGGGSIISDQAEITANNAEIAQLTLKPGGKYKFVRSVGFGGMKAVMQVKDKDTTRHVAMAIIPDAEDRPQEDVNRFIQEARITARLEHPNIVPVHDIGVDTSGSPYFTMKLLRGQSLADIIRKMREDDYRTLKEYDLTRLLRIFVKICNGIEFAHSKQVIHLDLKPDNIHVGDFGEVLILDWGLARFIGEPERESQEPEEDFFSLPQAKSSQQFTIDGITKGTPGYMAPEQAAGQNRFKDERSDIYALGAILYTILTFESPMAGKPLKDILMETIHGNIEIPKNPEALRRPIPAALEAVMLKAMSRNADDRYQTVNELREDIFAFLAGYAPKAEDASSIKKTYLFINRNWLASLFLITLAVLLGLCLWLVLLYLDDRLIL